MYQLTVLAKLLCLLLLAMGVVEIQADDFPQCNNVDADTFIVAIDDCTSYIYCNGENSFRDTCPEQTYFDGNAQECAFDDHGVCLQPVETTTVTPALETVSNAIDAEVPAVEIVTVTNTSDKDETHSEAATTTTAATQAEVKPAVPQGSRPHCDTTGDGYHPHPKRCEYYYSCLSGYLTIVRCPYKFGWDHTEGRCKPLSEAQCFSL